MRMPTIALFASLCAATGLSAQGSQQAQANPRAGVCVDNVVATVNDEVIMMSQLRTLVAGRLRTLEQTRGQRLTAAEREYLYGSELKQLIEKYTMAQAAKMFGFASPEMIEKLFRDELARDEQEQVRNLGTMQEFSRELQRQGRTWPAYVREQRVEKMREFAEEFSIRMRLQRQSNLFLTPSMLREAYQKNVDQFVRGSRAVVAMVVFRGDDARAEAERAAAMWQQEDIGNRELAARFPGAIAMDELDASSLDPAQPVAKFALAGPANAVSAPMELGGAFQVAKVLLFDGARNGRFEDHDVQVELQRICLEGVVEELRRQALKRAAQRAEVSLVQQPR